MRSILNKVESSMKKILTAFIIVSAFVPTMASAHGIGQVYALPVPLKFYLLGAGLTVAVSFFVLSVFLKKAKAGEQANREISAPWIKPLITVAKVIAFLLLLVTIATGIVGSQNATRNFAPVFFWIYFLLGMGVLSLVLGNIWDKVNPWKFMSDYINERESSRIVSGIVGAVLLLSLFWLELVSGNSFVPRIIGMSLVVYTLVNIVASLFYKNWYKDGELFSVLFGFIGNLAHFQFGSNNKSIIIINENNKLIGTPVPWWTLGTASILLAGASFDSLKETVMWFQWTKVFGLSGVDKISGTIGLLLAPLPFLLLYMLAIWIMKQLVGKEYKTIALAKQFVLSLVPIAFGYTLAHNFSLTIVTAPRMLALISDPFGFGWNLFGTARYIQTDLLLGAKMVWFIEIGFVILAHIFGVWYAHVLATNIFKDPKQALKSQYPMMILMVGFTIMTLWLLSAPLVVVTGK